MANTTVNQPIKRKVGDPLNISGVLGGDDLPALPWTGATAAISIRNAKGVLVVDRAAMALNVATGAVSYAGASIAAAPYEYEILVTWPGNVTRRFPDDQNLSLLVIPAVN
jgi:hypothetical protein